MEWTSYIRFIVALIFVLGLIGGLAWLARRYGLGGAIAAKSRATSKRLGVQEALAIDGKNRLVLLRRDNTEHLVILSSEGVTLIESGIPAPPNSGGESR
jgi:flagellar protein FliO/FliZ